MAISPAIFNKLPKSATFVTIIARTTPKLLAKHPLTRSPNPYQDIIKVSRVNGVINWIYENSVNNQRVREGNEPDFEAMPRKWGERIKGTPLVKHNEKFYLELKVERSIEYHYETSQGEKVDPDLIAPFLPERGESRQEVTKEIILRDYSLDGIVELKLNGEIYRNKQKKAMPF